MQRLQTDLNHLGPSLGGEDLTTPFVSDARHWVAVYSELVEGATKMGVGPKLAQLSARLLAWQRRLKELRDLFA